jgi:hypothetical protein
MSTSTKALETPVDAATSQFFFIEKEVRQVM